MDVVEWARHWGRTAPERPVHHHRAEILTFGELWTQSGRLASHLIDTVQPGRPIVVHGHKQSLMLVCFLGCVRSGHAYVPVDSSIPAERCARLVEASETQLVLAVSPLAHSPDISVLTADQISAVIADESLPQPPDDAVVGPDDPFYVIYTSGSTGTPKGVQISRDALARFAEWAVGLRALAPLDDPAVYLNQAPFSFDLSVFELASALASGSTIHSIDADLVGRLPALFAELGRADLTTWVSTPSFADLCLAADEFCHDLLPRLTLFLFCGETLSPHTVTRLHDRFPDAVVVNTYGPTESTVAVTSVVCTEAMVAEHPSLPVGAPKPGTRIVIRDPEGRELPDGQRGEIVIVGDTVSLGYHLRPDLTEAAFELIDGVRAYRTGDVGYLCGGQLFFCGRLDFQVKVHGYRIEIEDIEANLRLVDGVAQAVVVPVYADGSTEITHLRAIVQSEGGVPDRPLAATLELKRRLSGLVPDYMVPKVFTHVAHVPLTANGKVDRQAAQKLA